MNVFKATNVSVGDPEVGIVIGYEDGTMEKIPITKSCHDEQQRNAQAIASHHYHRGLKRALDLLPEKRKSEPEMPFPESMTDKAFNQAIDQARTAIEKELETDGS